MPTQCEIANHLDMRERNARGGGGGQLEEPRAGES